MKTRLKYILICFALICMTGVAQAALIVDGVVSYGGRDCQLIYDTDLDITWLDYSNFDYFWDNQMAWVSGLSLNVNGTMYDDWRLPTTVDGLYTYGWDGTTTGGYNITSSELGHLYYVSLNNQGYLDINGNIVEIENVGLINTGPFNSLIKSEYWSETENLTLDDTVWIFDFATGSQRVTGQVSLNQSYGIAVHDGRIAAVPLPGAFWVLTSGLAVLFSSRKKFNLSSCK